MAVVFVVVVAVVIVDDVLVAVFVVEVIFQFAVVADIVAVKVKTLKNQNISILDSLSDMKELLLISWGH